jgi:hypothetical protein
VRRVIPTCFAYTTGFEQAVEPASSTTSQGGPALKNYRLLSEDNVKTCWPVAEKRTRRFSYANNS